MALVAVIGRPNPAASAWARGWLEMRTPILPLPAVKRRLTAGAARNTKVRGPGQKAAISLCAVSEIPSVKASR